MRTKFDEELVSLNNSIIEMGAMIEDAISKTTNALINKDIRIAKKIVEDDRLIDEKEKEIEAKCLRLLLNQHPVASDLRLISVALKMITDMERIGDQASDISELCIELSESKSILNNDFLLEMANATTKMVNNSIDAFIRKDLQLAQDVIEYDDVVDLLYTSIKRELIQLILNDAENGEEAFDFLQIAKYYERIGDHATNISEWVIFSVTGEHKDKDR